MSRHVSLAPPGPGTTPVPGSARRPGPALLVIATAQFMVTLDTTIVNVALPHIQGALQFSGSGLEWVVNAYALTFGGLLLIGGRAGDLLGRRRVFAAGLLLFSAGSLAGGLAGSPAWLLAARAIQGTGAALAAPTALALIATTFPEGGQRNRAMGVYSAASAAGGALGLLAGGLLATYASWRWVFYVNVPIGVAVALAAPLVLAESPRQRGRFDLPGAIAATGGIATLVYGLSAAAASPDGTSHWGDRRVIASITAAVVLLGAFALIQTCSREPLLPARLLRDRDRSGAYLIMLCSATAMSAVFFFLTLFQETVWGYSALRTGVGYLPMTVAVLVGSAAAARMVRRIAVRPLLLVGSVVAAGGLYWLSRLSEHGSYTGTVLGPTVVVGCGLGLLSVPLSLTALSRVRDSDSGAAASLLNTGQQVGGSIGLAVLGTAAWTVAAGSARIQAARTAAAAARAGRSAAQAGNSAGLGGQLSTVIDQHALAVGFGRAFLAAAGIMLAALVITIARIHADVRSPEISAGASGHRRGGHERDRERPGEWRLGRVARGRWRRKVFRPAEPGAPAGRHILPPHLRPPRRRARRRRQSVPYRQPRHRRGPA
jgi:EmrB/QacA subfamily drug resistance transporter